MGTAADWGKTIPTGTIAPHCDSWYIIEFRCPLHTAHRPLLLPLARSASPSENDPRFSFPPQASGDTMTTRFATRFLPFLLLSLLVLAAAPESSGQATEQKEQFSETTGSVTIAGKKIEYQATAGRLPVKDMTGKAKANIYFTAYTRKTDAKLANRPLTFCFNGGPGTSSVFVHLGLFGPQRVLMDDDGLGAPQPVKMVENEYSILDLSDIVCIDPVSTGFSRSDDPKEAKMFHGLEEDTSSVGDFIKAYVTKYDRSKSPTYIAGESYGTTRSASLSSYVQSKGGVNLAGIMLISSVLNFQTLNPSAGNDLPYVTFFPTFTASAWHHKKLSKDLGNDLVKILDESEKFANGDYLVALQAGNQLSDNERSAMAKRVAKYSGLSEEFVLKSDLRIGAGAFRNELLRESGEVIGRLDARVKAKKSGEGKGGKGGGGDPSNSLIFGLYTTAMNDYMPNVLKYKTDLKYNISGQVGPWNYGDAGKNKYVDVATRLRSAMLKDQKLRVFVANGYCDQATPYFGTKYTIAHMGPRNLTDRVTMAYYDAGHMMYAHLPSLRQMCADMVKFLTTKPAESNQKPKLFAPALETAFSTN